MAYGRQTDRMMRKTLTIGGRKYAVVGTDPSKVSAKRRAEKIRQRGYRARIKRATRRGKVVYLIMQGGYRK